MTKMPWAVDQLESSKEPFHSFMTFLSRLARLCMPKLFAASGPNLSGNTILHARDPLMAALAVYAFSRSMPSMPITGSCFTAPARRTLPTSRGFP